MDTETSVMDTGTSTATPPSRVPNAVLLDLRRSQGWGRPRLAKELDLFCRAKGWPSPGGENLAKQIYRLETGRITTPDEFYTRLFCEFYKKTAHELFGCITPPREAAPNYLLRSHKFIPVYVGAEAAHAIENAVSMTPVDDPWLQCKWTSIPERGSSCRLYTWPYGVAMYHIVEDLAPESIAELAVWRRVSYRENITWADSQLRKLTRYETPDDPYVLSAYWVSSAPWEGVRLDTALRLLCIPRALIERDDDQRVPSQPHAVLVEQALLRDGFDHPGIADFGMKGISMAFASWSGVVYHPLAVDRSLTEEEIVRCELAVQAAWSYCNYIRSEIEQGNDPIVPDGYGWRFLRGLRSHLTTERPLETDQHRSMRDAIVQTSGLATHIAQAVETLRETEGDAR